ncbi:MAG: NAD(P)H-hydrate dehydratase [Desulfovibrio sp.]
MFEPLPTPGEMARWDRAAIEGVGIRGEILMENAGREALAVLRKAQAPLEDRRVLLLAGPGNNGGDAFVLARHLHNLGADVLLLHSRPRRDYRGHAGYHLRLAVRTGVPLKRLTRLSLSRFRDPEQLPDILVDGLLGTGFSGELRPDFQFHIQEANKIGVSAFVLALDIPSGLNGETGVPQPVAIRADATATFGAVKLGLALPEAAPFTGEVVYCDIGIPRACIQTAPPRHYRITPEIMDLVPEPRPEMHKGQAGRLLVIGGSPGLTGAPHLAALGALRGGCGLVTLAAPADLCAEAKAGRPEIMTLPLGTGQRWTPAMAEELAALLASEPERFTAVALGPGLGRDQGARAFLRSLGPRLLPPLVCDADALFHLADAPAILPEGAVITPHPGEAARLLGKTSGEIQSARLESARLLARNHEAVAVLKGAQSLVADPEGNLHLCPISAPALAVAGSGDVLTGLIGSLLARGISPLRAACLGVYWHGLAGLLLGESFPGRGCLAGEIADALPRVPHLDHKEFPC